MMPNKAGFSLGASNSVTASNTKSRYRRTFEIYLANGKRKLGLRKSFLVTMKIPKLLKPELEITLGDGSTWPIYFEPYAGKVVTVKEGYFILSFQTFEDGEYFAIARSHSLSGKVVIPSKKQLVKGRF